MNRIHSRFAIAMLLLLVPALLQAQAPATEQPPAEEPAVEAQPPQAPAAPATPTPRERAFNEQTRELFERLQQDRQAFEEGQLDAPLPEDVRQAVEAFRRGQEAPVIQRSNTAQHPFGESQPHIHCTPDRACDIQLQAGEVIYDVAVGDAKRWTVQPLTSGDPDVPTPHVIVQPSEHDIATNLIIGTSRRVYHVGLISPAAKKLQGAAVHYQRHLSFYYPEDIIKRWETADRLSAIREAKRQEDARRRRDDIRLAVPLEDVNFGYTIETTRKARKKKVTWVPVAVYDDTVRTYIQLPHDYRATSQPAIVLKENGESVVPNYHYDDATRKIVVHTVFQEAVLFQGVGKDKAEVHILAGAR